MYRIFFFSVFICLIFFSLGVSVIAADEDQFGFSFDPDRLEIVEVVPDELTVDTLTVNAASVLLSEESEVYSVDAPSGHWVEVSGAPVDMIYLPANYSEDSFFVSNGCLYGMNSSTITGYADGYLFRFAPYATPQYRSDSQTYTWQDINLILVDAYGVEVEGYSYYFDQKFWLLFAALGVLLFCLFMKR